MATDELAKVVEATEENLTPKISRRLRAVLSDAYAFVRSREANAALATVTLESLMGDQIKTNGESGESLGAQYNPYSYDPEEEAPASTVAPRTNFLGGSPIGTEDNPIPTKMDRVLAIQSELTSVIEDVKKIPPVEVSGIEEYADHEEEGVET